MCQRSSDQFYILTYYIKWVTTSWTHSNTALIKQMSLFDTAKVMTNTIKFQFKIIKISFWSIGGSKQRHGVFIGKKSFVYGCILYHKGFKSNCELWFLSSLPLGRLFVYIYFNLYNKPMYTFQGITFYFLWIN